MSPGKALGSPPPAEFEPETLFVYGSLLPGLPLHPLLASAIPLGPGRIQGRLYDLGEYPGAVEVPDGTIHGEAYRLPEPGRLLARLDVEEGYDPANEAGSLFRRRRIPVTLADGRVVTAWVYLYAGPLERVVPIPSGDYRRHLARRHPSPNPRVQRRQA